MNLLENKARERGTVLIISHHDLKDWCRQVQTITMHKGQATSEGVLDYV
jgi:predicted ABC-type transport system involved in lysophospholipase L1 biosynthesis ATPase subunit